ncbi:Bug family tripartite tricarboxylate transporter substrate binding protein [Hydrogenophaga sp.]|uniref:Bug family tripartite tricarboxylate transporter substrate binding protein n=1 Tax=Hydrogenophaga sp. TaxID=1904254 RepID=UPI002FCC444B
MKHPLSRRHLIAGAGSALASLSFPTVWAQAWPLRPIRIVVPFAPGAGTDAVGRLVAEKLAELLPATVVVENRVGASGAIGAQAVAHSAPDGHTLLLVAAPFTTVPAALPGAGYEPLAQFTPVGMIATGPLVWAANKDLPARTLAEVVQLAHARPGFYNYGSAGAGGINHLVLELLKVRTGAFITHIPYRGIAPAVLDMMGGQIHLVTGTVPALAPFIRDGRIKALAVTSDRRTPALPDVPSMVEAGQAGFNVLNYFGLVAPHGTPPEVVGRLNAAIARLVTLPEVKARFSLDALEPAAGTPADLGRFLAADLQSWLQVVARQKLQVAAS